MKSNVGTTDRAIRLIAGIAILSLAFIGPKSAWGYLGLIPLVSAVIGFCPAYTLFGIRTCAMRGQDPAVKT